MEALLDIPFVRYLIWALVLVVLYVLISAHYSIETQMFIGYFGVAVVLLVIPFEKIPKWLELFVKMLAVVIVLRYLWWRTFESLTYEGFFDFIGATLLYVAELFAIAIYLLGIFTTIDILKREKKDLAGIPPEELPKVDVLIPTYNEPQNIIENTVLAALALDYPKERYTVYLLDDGGTVQKRNDPDPQKAEEARKRHESLKKFCQMVGAVYMTREKNEHAKAGNLNTALKKIDGDLILILDTDHIPAKQFLQRTVRWFIEDPKVFLVQTPHAFYNPDPIERNLYMSNTAISENDMFYKKIQLGNDFWNSAFFCGSAAVLRRKHLDELGGIAGETVTEDAETAIKLHDKGYKSVYVDEPMIRGLQTETFEALVLQRIRWTQGMIQIFLLKNPILSKGLRWYQRLSYTAASFFWFFAYSRVIFYIAPLLYLYFGLKIYNANNMEMVAYVIPHMLMAILMSYFLYAKVRNPFFSELYETVLSFFTLPAILSVLKNPREPKFKVTPKGLDTIEDHVSGLASVFVILFTLVAIGFGFAVYRYIHYPQETGVVLMTSAWNLMNFLLLLAAIGVVSEKHEYRRYVRVPLETRARIIYGNRSLSGIIVDISEQGINIRPDRPSEIIEKTLREAEDLKIEIADIDGEFFTIPVKFLRTFGWGEHIIFVFDDIYHNIPVRQKLIQLIYGNTTKWSEIEEKKPVMNPLQSFFYIVRQGYKNAMLKRAYATTFRQFKDYIIGRI
ncbi:MAG: UDP-forming cellulose synthase catalytic subunit [Epsilonproteobacteria bacterium]|nr:UDP-forming cellulose synthase catalytic subunit [Campylobacterota bacterium]